MISGHAGGKEITMEKHERTKKENKNKKAESRFQSLGSGRFFEMMNQRCEGQTGVPDCCSKMTKMWEKMQGKSQEKERKQK